MLRNLTYALLTAGLVSILPTMNIGQTASADDWDDRWEDYWDDYEDAREDYFEERHHRDRRNWDDYRTRFDHRRYRNPRRGTYYRGPVYPYRGGYYGRRSPRGYYYSRPGFSAQIGPLRFNVWD